MVVNLREVVRKMQNEGVEIKIVKRSEQMTESEYASLEMRTSRDRAFRISSEDILALMELAVDTNDEKWFKKLSAKYSHLLEKENEAMSELGII